jgi:beta-lactamase regulating signal transducer with metallopeptidase domain
MTGTSVALLVLKVSLLLGAALFAARVLRRAPAARRHGVWSAAFIALIALPLLAVTLPGWRVPVPAWPAVPPVASAAVASDITAGAGGVSDAPPAPAARQPLSAPAASASPDSASIRLPSLRATLLAIWLAGALAALIALCTSLVRVANLAAASKELDDDTWRAVRDRVKRRLDFRRPVRVLASDTISTPMAGGVVRPTVFVPADAATWSDERREVVLAHEIAHLASGDPIRHLVSRVAFTLYWFHPLVWLAVRKSTADCEQACDEAVLALGVRPSTYARVLLEFAEAAPRRIPAAALPMVKRARLESRLMAILNSAPGDSKRRRALLPAIGAAALTLSIAAAQPAPSVPVTVAELATPTPAIAGKPAAHATVTPKRSTAAATASTLPTAPATAAAALTPATVSSAEPVCWTAPDSRAFNGSISTNGTIVYEQIGRRGNDRVIQKRFGDLRVCMVTEGFTGGDDHRPSGWPGRATRVILETDRPNDLRRMEIVGGRVSWTVNGQARGVDADADAWRRDLLDVLDATWEVSLLHGERSSLRGRISSIHGERSSLQGRISSLRGEVSSMRGMISSARGEESSLRGEISSIRGHVSSLKGQISSERGAISSLQASRWDRADRDDIAARIRRHEDEIRRIEDEIVRYDADARVREVERRIARLDTERKVEEIERRIREFDLEEKIAAVNRQLADLDVEGRVDRIERDIISLDVDDRAREMEERRDEALARLRATLGR